MLQPSDCQCGHAHVEEPETDENDEEQKEEVSPSLAYKLWHPWRLVVMNPLPVLIVFVIANTLFVTIGGLLRLLAQLLTLPGLLVAILLALILGIRRIASLMAYPGQLKLVIREGEANFARLTKRRLQIFVEAAAELAAVLDPTTSNKPIRLRFLQVHQNFSFALETLMLPVLQSLEILERDGTLKANGVKLLKSLREIDKINSQKLAEPCSKLCSASQKAFELQRLKMFGQEKEEPAIVKTTEPVLKKLFGGTSKPALKRSTTVDSASLEAAAKPKPAEVAHPLVSFAVAVRRLQTAIPLIGRPQTDAPATRNLTWIAKELCRGSTPEVDYIATLEMLRADMTVRFKAEQIWIPGYHNHQVDAMLIPPASSGRDAGDRPVVILCNPNGGLYELHHLQMDWIKFYTSEMDCHVLVYNYRGYGRCKGSPSPELHNLDGIAIVNYLKTDRGMKRIAIHGESIGGLVATYVARTSPDVNVLIADRTFATIPALAQRMIAKWAGTVVDWVMRWETDNVQNYLEATCAKLLCSDPCDEIILDGASLKSGVALSVELGEKTFNLPRQREADGSPVAPASPTNFLRKTRVCCGSRSKRRVSEAASRPQVGEPLTETMVARFSDAVLSVGRRAFESTTIQENGDDHEETDGSKKISSAISSSHVTISVDDVEASGTTTTTEADTEQHPMLSTDPPAPITVSATFPNELVAVVWMQLARLDGYCGQCLLQAAENGGYDKIRAWTASLLAWGGRVAPERRTLCSLEPFDRDGISIVPTTVAEVHATLQQLIEQYPPLKFDYDIGFLVLMVEYLHDSLQRRWRHLDSTKSIDSVGKNEAEQMNKNREKTSTITAEQSNTTSSLLINTGDPKLGCLLPLHCGHNKNFQETEKEALVVFLKQAYPLISIIYQLEINMRSWELLWCLASIVLVTVAVKQPMLPTGKCVVHVPKLNVQEVEIFRFSCRVAALGAYLPNENVEMKLIVAPDENMMACSPFVQSNDDVKDPLNYKRAAVVVRRGKCSFQQKLNHVSATEAALMLLVNSEEDLITLSSLEYEYSSTSAVSVTLTDGERLIQLIQGFHDDSIEALTEVKLTVSLSMGLVSQIRARLQFLVDINAPVAVYEEYWDAVEQLESFDGQLDELLSRISRDTFKQLYHHEVELIELMRFFSWCSFQLSKWGFSRQAALHASVSAAVLQFQLWSEDKETQSGDVQGQLLVRTTVYKLTEAGYYSHSVSLVQKLLKITESDTDKCQLSFVTFLQGDLVTSFSLATTCTSLELENNSQSLKVAQDAFLGLIKLKRSDHDNECLKLAERSINDTTLALKCCSNQQKPDEFSSSVSRKFSSFFTKELFETLIIMAVFLDELGPFQESLNFISYASQMCEGDKTMLEVRQLLAVPIVFSSQNEINLFVSKLESKIQTFTETHKRLEERVILPMGSTEKAVFSETNPLLRPETAAYFRYTITPSTMFIGYQGINVLPIQQGINKLRSTIYPSLTSSYNPKITPKSDGKRRRIGFISTWFRVHSVGKLLLGVVEHLDRTKFQVMIYRCVHFLRDSDEITERFKQAADEYVELPTSQDAAMEIIRQAQLDVAVFPELGMDEWTVLLSHHRLAPIQCVFWGHPITTGNPHIDYFISSEHFVSKHFEELEDEFNYLSGYRRASFSEQIVLFRGLSTMFTEPKPLTAESKDISRSRLYLPTNGRIYLCPQTLMKLHPAFDEAMAGILERDEKATIVLLASDTQTVWMEQLCRRFRKRFGRNHRRVLFLPTLPFHEFQALLSLADVLLDPFPFGGGVTTLDALHLGIPVVTLPAAQSVVHLAAGFLRSMNASDCIADSVDEYVKIAVNIATDHEEIRPRLLAHRSDIYHDKSTIEDWNTFLETVVQRKK